MEDNKDVDEADEMEAVIVVVVVVDEVEVGVEKWTGLIGRKVKDDEDDLLVLVFIGGIRNESGPDPVSPSAPCPAPRPLQLTRNLDKPTSCLT